MYIYSMLPQTPVFFMNVNAPPPHHPLQEPNKNKTKNMNKKKQEKKTKYSSTQYIDIIKYYVEFFPA